VSGSGIDIYSIFERDITMSDPILKSLDSIESNLQSYKSEQIELRDRVLELEQKRSVWGGDGNIKAETIGDQFVKAFDANKELFQKTKSVRLEVKAAADAITTTSGRHLVSAGVGSPDAYLLGLQNALTVRASPATTAVEYSRFTGIQGAAAVQTAEGAAKAPVRPDHLLVTQTALTVAGYAKMSRQAMSDSAELRRAVDTTLARSVNLALDVALTTGGTGFAGGFVALATASTSLVYSSLIDAISEGVSAMQSAGFSPSTVALSPADWLAATVMKSTTGEYLSGAFLGTLPAAMRGLKVVLSPTIAAGKALLIDSANVELLVVDAFTIEVAYSGDDFTNNLVTILGETRVIPVMRAVGAMRLITPKAAA
jgi:hypothetical protein